MNIHPDTPIPEGHKIKPLHWTEGGTGLTNFHPDKLDKFLSSIKEHGVPGICISLEPLAGHYDKPKGYYSLHRIEGYNTSAFWITHRELNKGSL